MRKDKKHSKEDHKFSKPTTQENLIHQKIADMRVEFEMRMLNMVAQLRAISIAAGITPKQFLEAFNNYQKQNEFFQELDKNEKIILAKRNEEMEKMKQNLGQAGVIPQTPETEDMILGVGDKIE